jgi:hypothetical protein
VNVTKCIEDRLENELTSGPKIRIPEQVTNLTVTLKENLCGFDATWAPPPKNDENMVIGYEIQVMTLKGNWESYKHCMNTNSTQMLCSIQLRYLTVEPFSLQIGWPIFVRVSAKNIIGSG